jgi:hypothetical protein
MKKIILLCLLAPSVLWAQQSYDALFLGNSYTAANNLPHMVAQIALSMGDTLNYEANTPGGCTLNGHTTNATSQAKIKQQAWDFVVIQAQSQEPSFPPSQVASDTYPYAAQLVDSIAANDSCTEPVFFMTWGRKNGDAQNAQFYPILGTYLGMQWRLRQSYLEMGMTHDATVAPVGMAWKESIATNPTYDLYSPDESHPSLAGSYLSACVFYSTLFQKSCVGSTYMPAGIGTADAVNLQTIASNTVLDSTAVWNMFAFQSLTDTVINDSASFAVEASNADGYHWDFGDGNTSTDQNPSHVYATPANYEVVVTAFSNAGCLMKSDTLMVTAQGGNGLFESVNATVTIYPNPTTGVLNCQVDKSAQVQLYSAQGKLLLEQYGSEEIDLSSQPSGIYFLRISGVDKELNFQVLKQ